MKTKFNKIRGQVNLKLLITGIVAVAFVAMVAPIIFSMAGMVDVEKCLDILRGQGYVIYGDSTGDIIPKANCTYDLGSDTYRWDDIYLCNGTIHLGATNITADGDTVEIPKIELSGASPIILTGDAKSWIEFRPDLDPTKLSKNTKPTMVERGIIVGYSLPTYTTDEELFYSICVPNRWDGESDIHVHIHGWLDTAQDNATDAVNLTLEWEHFSIGEVVPVTNNTVYNETVVGIVATANTSVQFDFTIDYDGGTPILHDDHLAFRLFRVASGHEIDGEVVICHAGVIFKCDKLGNPTYE